MDDELFGIVHYDWFPLGLVQIKPKISVKKPLIFKFKNPKFKKNPIT
jgi:hypothetical protein